MHGSLGLCSRMMTRRVVLTSSVLLTLLVTGCGQDDRLILSHNAACEDSAIDKYQFPINAFMSDVKVTPNSDGSVEYFQERLRRVLGHEVGVSTRLRDWRLLIRTSERVAFVQRGPDGRTNFLVDLIRKGDDWDNQGSEPCTPVRMFDGSYRAVLTLPRNPIDRERRTIPLLATPTNCLPKYPPLTLISEEKKRVVVTAGFMSDKSDGDVACNEVDPNFPFKITLKRKLGSRQLYDGAFVPPRPLPAYSPAGGH